MAINRRFLLTLLMTLVTVPAIAQAQAPAPAAAGGPVYGVTYFEAGPAAANAVAAALKQFAAATRKEDGNTGFAALREAGRPGRFAFVEGWRDKKAIDAHAAAAKALQEQVQANLAAPFDVRPSSGLAVATTLAGVDQAMASAVYVVTHVDVPPPAKDDCIGLLKQLTENSRKDAGVLRFDVLQQDSRPNHFTVVEAWRDRKSHDAHIMADHTREYRRKLTPMSGALFDERVYEAIR
jgi:quinol monooxygenase YgiN